MLWCNAVCHKSNCVAIEEATAALSPYVLFIVLVVVLVLTILLLKLLL